MSYDILALRKEHEILLASLNHEQHNIYASIMQVIATESGRFFFFFFLFMFTVERGKLIFTKQF